MVVKCSERKSDVSKDSFIVSVKASKNSEYRSGCKASKVHVFPLEI